MLKFLIIFLIVITAIALILFLITFPKAVIRLHYKGKKLKILIRLWLYKKEICYDFGEEPQKKQSRTEKTSDGNEKKKADFKDKIKDAGGRVFSKEKGFDLDEARNVLDELKNAYRDVAEPVRKLLSNTRYKIEVPQLSIDAELGTGDPADTGMIYGSVWSAVGTVYPLLTRYMRINYPTINITPDFYSKRFDIEIKSIIKVRPLHIINAVLSALFVPMVTYLKNKKGREG